MSSSQTAVIDVEIEKKNQVVANYYSLGFFLYTHIISTISIQIDIASRFPGDFYVLVTVICLIYLNQNLFVNNFYVLLLIYIVR